MQKKHHHHRKKSPQGILNNGNLFRDATGMGALSQLTTEQIRAVTQNNAKLSDSANQMAENAHQYNMNKQAVKDGLLHPQSAAAAARKQARENAKTQSEKHSDAYNRKVADINGNANLTDTQKQAAIARLTDTYSGGGGLDHEQQSHTIANHAQTVGAHGQVEYYPDGTVKSIKNGEADPLPEAEQPLRVTALFELEAQYRAAVYSQIAYAYNEPDTAGQGGTGTPPPATTTNDTVPDESAATVARLISPPNNKAMIDALNAYFDAGNVVLVYEGSGKVVLEKGEEDSADNHTPAQKVLPTFPIECVQPIGAMTINLFITPITDNNGINISSINPNDTVIITNYIQNNILQVWNNQQFFVPPNKAAATTNITLNVVNTPPTAQLQPNSFIILIGDRNVRSYADRVAKTAYVDFRDIGFNPNVQNQVFNNTAAHEFGHLLGLDDRYHYYQREESNTVTPTISGGGRNGNRNTWQNTFDTVPAILPNFYDDDYVWNTNLYSNPVSSFYGSVTNLQVLIFVGNYQRLQNGQNIVGEDIPIWQYTFFGLSYKSNVNAPANVDFINSLYFNPLGMIQKINERHYVVTKGFFIKDEDEDCDTIRDNSKNQFIYPQPTPIATQGVIVSGIIMIGTYEPGQNPPLLQRIVPITEIKVSGTIAKFEGMYRPALNGFPAQSHTVIYGHKLLWNKQNSSNQFINRTIIMEPYAGGG